MSGSQAALRLDNPSYPAFLMIQRPPPLEEAQRRSVEWLLATWLCLADTNVLGVRRVEEERDGQNVLMLHVAIPLEYQRKQLARSLRVRQIEDASATPRINLQKSHGYDEPHSFIRVPQRTLIKRFASYILSALEAEEVNDSTIGEPESTLEEDPRFARRKRSEEDARIRSAVRNAMALRNAAIEPDQIQTLVDRSTREKWIRILNVEVSHRLAVKEAILEAGIRRASASASAGVGWTVIFPASEARKLLF